MSSIRERNRDVILRAASEEKGFAATKTSDIAARAGLPKPNVYYYFKSKENLYREVLESIVEPLLEASAPFNQPGHPAEVLRAYIRTKIRISRDHAYASKVFASEIMHGAPHLSPERTAQLNAQAAHNIACIQGWIDQGLMAPSTPATCSSASGPRPRPTPTSTGRSAPSPARPGSTRRTTMPPPTPSSAGPQGLRNRRADGGLRLRTAAPAAGDAVIG